MRRADGENELETAGEKLKLGKGVAFVKSQLKRLRQENETWEADFRAMPKPLRQSATHFVGMVLSQPHGILLAQSDVSQSPTVNDFATLLADAMRRPLVPGQHRPARILLRGNPRWKPLFGDQESFGFVVRALDYGGLVFEDDKPLTLAEAMAVLEAHLTRWFEEEDGS